MVKTLKEIINNKELLTELEEDKDNYVAIIRRDASDKYIDLINYCYDIVEKVFASEELKDKIREVDITNRMKNAKSICSCLVKDPQGKIIINGENYRLESNAFKLIHYIVGQCLIKFYNKYVDIISNTSLYKEQEKSIDKNFLEAKTKSVVIKGLELARNDEEVKLNIQHINPNIEHKFTAIDFPSREDYIKSVIDTSIFIAIRRTKKNLTISDEHGNSVL